MSAIETTFYLHLDIFNTVTLVKRKFAINLFLLLLLNLLVKPFWIFGIDRTVQNMVGAGEYGLFYSLFNFSLLLNIILDFGITNFNNREISRHSHLASKYLSNIISIKILLAFVYCIVCLAGAMVLGYDSRQLHLLLLLVLNQFIASFILYLRSNLSGLQYFKTDSVLSVLDRFLMIIICSLLIWGNIFNTHFTIEWFIYAQTISYSITLLTTFIALLVKMGRFSIRFDSVFAFTILKQSYPYALLILLMSLYSRVDSVMLERMLPNGKVESGIYAQAFRIVDAANMLPFLFASLLLPMFSRMIKNQEPIQPFVGFAFALLFLPSFAISTSCIVYRNELMQLLYHQHTTESSVLLGILMVSFFMISINYIFGTLLTANGSIKMLNYISLLGVGISLLVNMMLIPFYNSVGAAIANLTTQVVVAILQFLFAYKVFNFKILTTKFIPFICYIPLTILIAFLFKVYISNWAIGFVFTLTISTLIGFLFRIIKVRELYTIMFKE